MNEATAPLMAPDKPSGAPLPSVPGAPPPFVPTTPVEAIHTPSSKP